MARRLEKKQESGMVWFLTNRELNLYKLGWLFFWVTAVIFCVVVMQDPLMPGGV